jgi:F420-0:gamma-glutamyl ligase
VNVTQIKTRKILPPKDDLRELLAYVPSLADKSIVAVSSKVVSICEGHTIPTAAISHEELVGRLASLSVEPIKRSANGMILTQVGNVLVESAGVDISNGNGYYILLPKNPYQSARTIWSYLKKRDKLQRLGVVITDSHAVPRRRGSEGYALATYGFRAAYEYSDKRDIFARKMAIVSSDMADGLAAAAVLVMGESAEITPIAVITGLERVRFFRKRLPLSTARRYAWVNPDLDVYAPLLNSDLWHRGSSTA